MRADGGTTCLGARDVLMSGTKKVRPGSSSRHVGAYILSDNKVKRTAMKSSFEPKVHVQSWIDVDSAQLLRRICETNNWSKCEGIRRVLTSGLARYAEEKEAA